MLCIAIPLLSQSKADFTTDELRSIRKQQIRLSVCDSVLTQMINKSSISFSNELLFQETIDKQRKEIGLIKTHNLYLKGGIKEQANTIDKLNRNQKILKIGVVSFGGLAILSTSIILLK
jgi:hypothetical protein